MERLPRTILCEINALQQMDAGELRNAYGHLIGYDTKCGRVDYLRRLIAYKLQERHYGMAVSGEDMRRMNVKNESDKELRVQAKTIPNVRAGTRFARVWEGVEHEVTMRDDGQFEYNGAIYKSLSAVARLITGTRWNGWKFFGVNK